MMLIVRNKGNDIDRILFRNILVSSSPWISINVARETVSEYTFFGRLEEQEFVNYCKVLSVSLSSANKNIDEYVYLEGIIASQLRKISKIIRIMSYRHESTQSIWSFIEKDDRKSRRKIYEVELRIIRQFPEVEFDFHVLPLNKISATSFPTEAKFLYWIR